MSNTESDVTPAAVNTAPLPVLGAPALSQPWAMPLGIPGTPGAAVSGPIYPYTFKTKQGRVKGGNTISEFMEGQVTLATDAIYLQGKAMLAAEKRVVYSMFGALGAALISSIRVDRMERLPWECIDKVVLEAEKKRVCIVYRLPAKPKRGFSLAFRVGDLYDNFAQAVRYLAPDKVSEGKIGPATPVWVWIVFAVFFAFMIWAVAQPNH